MDDSRAFNRLESSKLFQKWSSEPIVNTLSAINTALTLWTNNVEGNNCSLI
jgi:hypothetical protein